MLKVLPIFGLFSLVINTFECSGVEKINDNSWSLTGAIRRNSSTGSTQNRPVAASTKPIKRISSLQSTPKTSRQSSPFHRYNSASTPGSPLLLKNYQPQVTQVNMSYCMPAKNYGSLFRSKSSTDKNNESLKNLLTKSSTYPNDSKNGQNQQSNQTQKGLLSRFIKRLTKKIKEKKLASIEEEMPEKAKVNKEQKITASLEAEEKRMKKEQEKQNQTALEKPNKTVRGKHNQTVLDILQEKQKQAVREKQNQTVLEKQNQTVLERQNQTVLEKQNKTVRGKHNQTVLDILQEKQNQTVLEMQNQTVREKQNKTAQGKSKKPKSGKQQQQTMPLESVEMPKKRVVLSNRRKLDTFFENADDKSESQMTINEDPGEASFRHFVNSDGKIERALSSPTVKREKEEIPGESSYRFSSSPDFLKKLEATSEDEGSDKSSFGFPSPADSVPTPPAEQWWQIQSNGQGENVSG
ncbi:hypothetical protein niasHS_002903 [Heterodera schachtii]|uniref:Uncharacterized protein n=1 Tax=Heterodera schachtii TaxID=97005 RepID=A0ABD2K9C9_HETSC